MMKIQMPEGVDIFAFIGADLPVLEPLLGPLRAGAVGRAAAGVLEETAAFHVPEHDRIGRHRAQGGLLFHDHGQIIGVQLVTPTGMLVILDREHFPLRRTERRMLALIGANPAGERAHRIGFRAERPIKPALDGRTAKLDPLAMDRMAPLLVRQFLEFAAQFAPWRGRHQQRSNHAKTKVRPPLVGPR